MNLLSVTEARKRILQNIQPVSATQAALQKASGCVLSENILTRSEYPPFSNSAMDGFAVRAADTRHPPVVFHVVGDIPAGTYPDFSLQPGQAARIMTGAPLPNGADAVIPVEETDFNDRTPGIAPPKQVQVYLTVQPGDYVRQRGSDMSVGEMVFSAGHRLRASDLGTLAALGIAQVPVFRQPRVALLSSGDELVPVEQPLAPGKIHDSNSHTLAAFLEEQGCQVIELGVAKDQSEDILGRLERAVTESADLIITSAGVSVGSFDFVKEVIEQNGELGFWRVNMRPGKPLAFGNFRNIPLIGLPGNPVSAFVGALVFIRPALEKLRGMQPREAARYQVTVSEAIQSDGRESYLRAWVEPGSDGLHARLTGHQGSGNFFSLVQANALLIIPSGVKSLAPGDKVDAWLL